MATPDQTQATRPISFTLMNNSSGELTTLMLVVRPEELSKMDPSRTTVHQTLGGAWIDSFGQGLSQIQISGTTGWGIVSVTPAYERPDGSIVFQALFDSVFKQWHEQRDALVAAGQDPNLVQLIFSDVLDGYTEVCVPMQFVLKRSRTRPLLFQYLINMVSVAKDITAVPAGTTYNYVVAMGELRFAINAIAAIVPLLTGLGIVGLVPLVNTGAAVLTAFGNLVGAGLGALNGALPATLTTPFAVFTGTLSQAAANALSIIRDQLTLLQTDNLMLGKAQRNFQTSATIIANFFQGATTIPNYSALQSSSGGSSFVGGVPQSIYETVNAFSEMFPSVSDNVQYSGLAAQSMQILATNDTVLSPLTLSELTLHMQTIADGVQL